MTPFEKEGLAEKILGYPGALISFSKSGYRERNPDNLVVFNSNIYSKNKLWNKAEKIWFGDIDISLSLEKIKTLAKEINGTIYILYEMDGRFNNEDNPKINNYVIKVRKDGTWELGENLKEYFPHFPGKK